MVTSLEPEGDFVEQDKLSTTTLLRTKAAFLALQRDQPSDTVFSGNQMDVHADRVV